MAGVTSGLKDHGGHRQTGCEIMGRCACGIPQAVMCWQISITRIHCGESVADEHEVPGFVVADTDPVSDE